MSDLPPPPPETGPAVEDVVAELEDEVCEPGGGVLSPPPPPVLEAVSGGAGGVVVVGVKVTEGVREEVGAREVEVERGVDSAAVVSTEAASWSQVFSACGRRRG